MSEQNWNAIRTWLGDKIYKNHVVKKIKLSSLKW